MAILDGGEPPHQATRPAAPGESGEQVVARLAGVARYDADRAWQRRPRKLALQLQQALGVEPLAQAVDAGEQVTLSRHAHVADGE